MKQITKEAISACVARLCMQAACVLGDDMMAMLRGAHASEVSPAGKDALRHILDNAALARDEGVAMCQDTGIAVVWADVGTDVYIQGDFMEAVNEGVRRGYGSLRKSVLDPLTRVNTNDNTPAVVHVRLVPGDAVRLTVAPKGAGSENMSQVKMLKPAQGREGIFTFVREAVIAAGANPCPPVIVGVGIGSTMEGCALLAKRALLRSCGATHERDDIAALESELLEAINASGIGPQGFGGQWFALAVHIEAAPTHIACLPVAVNLQCHAARHATAVL